VGPETVPVDDELPSPQAVEAANWLAVAEVSGTENVAAVPLKVVPSVGAMVVPVTVMTRLEAAAARRAAGLAAGLADAAAEAAGSSVGRDRAIRMPTRPRLTHMLHRLAPAADVRTRVPPLTRPDVNLTGASRGAVRVVCENGEQAVRNCGAPRRNDAEDLALWIPPDSYDAVGS
jgi:hypothetical protein